MRLSLVLTLLSLSFIDLMGQIYPLFKEREESFLNRVQSYQVDYKQPKNFNTAKDQPNMFGRGPKSLPLSGVYSLVSESEDFMIAVYTSQIISKLDELMKKLDPDYDRNKQYFKFFRNTRNYGQNQEEVKQESIIHYSDKKKSFWNADRAGEYGFSYHEPYLGKYKYAKIRFIQRDDNVTYYVFHLLENKKKRSIRKALKKTKSIVKLKDWSESLDKARKDSLPLTLTEKRLRQNYISYTLPPSFHHVWPQQKPFDKEGYKGEVIDLYGRNYDYCLVSKPKDKDYFIGTFVHDLPDSVVVNQNDRYENVSINDSFKYMIKRINNHVVDSQEEVKWYSKEELRHWGADNGGEYGFSLEIPYKGKYSYCVIRYLHTDYRADTYTFHFFETSKDNKQIKSALNQTSNLIHFNPLSVN